MFEPLEDETGIIHDQPSSGACEWNFECEPLEDETGIIHD